MSMTRIGFVALALLLVMVSSLDILNLVVEEPEQSGCRGETISVVAKYESLLKDPAIFVVKLDDPHGFYRKKNPYKVSLGAGEYVDHRYELTPLVGLDPGRYELPLVAYPAISPQFTIKREIVIVVKDCVAEGATASTEPSEGPEVSSAATATATATAGGGADDQGGSRMTSLIGIVLAIIVLVMGLALFARSRAIAQQAALQQQQQATTMAQAGYYGYQYPAYQGSSYYAGRSGYANVYGRY